jgi:hypothetical protein
MNGNHQFIRLLCVFALAFAASAQFDQGQISGTIKDSSQSVIAGAAVTVKSQETGQTVTATTDVNGAFLFVGLRVGFYEVSVQTTGFKAYTRTNVKVDAAARATLDVLLEIGAVTESITVSGGVATSVETAQIGRTIESKQINELALN